jgi:hypothetical protein
MAVINPEDLEILTKLGIESFEHIPKYAFKEAIDAIIYIKGQEDSGLFHPGLYYIVLIDLTASTEASIRLGPEANKTRVEEFIRMTIKGVSESDLVNRAIFVKEIGDASLFIFSHFGDIINWSKVVNSLFTEYNAKFIEEGKEDFYQIKSKICVHIGEVVFSDRRNPLALAINQLFKIEKLFPREVFGITDHVKDIITPRIESGEVDSMEVTKTTLPGEKIERPLWSLRFR